VQDYVLVSVDRPLVDHFRRGDGSEWIYRERGRGELVELRSVGCGIAVDEIYRWVFPAA
jgi:Uma2 family endonuclease